MASKKQAKRPRNSQLTEKKEDRRGKNPNSLANLRLFEPGQSGNPSGRPKLLGESYKEWLAKVNAQGMTNAEAVALAMGLEALKGDVGAAREIRAATEGDTLNLEGAVMVSIDR